MNFTIKFAGKGKAKPTDIDWMYYSPNTYKSDTKYTITYEENDQQNYIYGTEPANSDISKYLEIELGNDALLSTELYPDAEIEPTRAVYHGVFTYNTKGEFVSGTIESASFAAGRTEHSMTFSSGIKVNNTSFYGIGKKLFEEEVERNGRIQGGIQLEDRQYFLDGWDDSPFGQDLIGTPNSKGVNSEAEGNDTKPIFKINAPSRFKVKNIDKIINFNPSIDTLEINTDSFGIDRTATFASGKNKKTVKKKLVKQDFDFLYDEKKGGLYFNENGSDKGFGDGGIIAILKGAPDLTAENLEFA